MKNFYCRQTVAPSAEPVSLVEAKAWLRQDDNDQDGVICDLITMAREFCENYTGRAGVTATYMQVMDFLPLVFDDRIAADYAGFQPSIRSNLRPYLDNLNVPLMRSPVQAISSVKYYAGDGTLTTLSTSAYVAAIQREPARLAPAAGYAWPTTQDRPEAVQITFTAGYAVNDVPLRFKQAIRLILAHHYEHRESVSEIKLEEVPQSAIALLDQLSVHWQFV